MESSSGDSFLWTDASNDSSISNTINMPKKSKSDDHIEEIDANKEHSVPDSLDKNVDKKSHKGTKRKKSVDSPNSTNHLQSEEKRIKLEPESDLEVKKKKTRKKAGAFNNDDLHSSSLDDEVYLNEKVKEEQSSISSEVSKPKKKKRQKNSVSEDFNHEDLSGVDESMKEMKSYLDMKVKEEQVSFISPKDVNSKKNKKNKSVDINIDKNHGEFTENSNDMENYLNLRVKEEQASGINVDQPKSKKKKKRQSSVSDIESINESKSICLDRTTAENGVTECAEPSNIEYSIIEEKFSAEETVVQNPKKKKHRKDTVNHPALCDTRQGYSDDDTSLQPDFSCNNIVSSTIINTSIDSRNKLPNNEANNITEDSILQYENKSPRITKISDRIRFEDDENSTQELVTTRISSKLKDFLQMNTNIQVAPQMQGCSITNNDEIWILKCPVELDPTKLKSTKVMLEGKSKIKINGQTFDGVPNEDQKRITLLTNQHRHVSVSNFPVNGSVIYRKRIPKTNVPQNVNVTNIQPHFIPLPETKCRHPLFGNKYKKAMKIPTEVAERLEAAKSRQIDDSCDNLIKKKKKKKKNKSMDVKIEEKLSPEAETLSNKRKRKLIQDNDIPYKRRKQIKHDPDSVEVWESEKAIEENLFNF